MTRQQAVDFLAREVFEGTDERDHLDGNLDAELLTFGDEVRERAWELQNQSDGVKGTGDAYDGPVCRECGEPCFVDHESGTSHHADDDSPDGIDHDADARHVAIPEDADADAHPTPV